MSARGRRWVGLAGALLLGALAAACAEEEQPDLDLDFGGVCKELELAYVDPPTLLPGWTIHAAVADGAELGGWALVSQDPAAGLQLIRLGAGDATPIQLWPNVADADEFSLLRGPLTGESWVVLSGAGAFRLWRLNTDGVASSADFDDFPSSNPSGWERRLLFIERQAYVLASPTSSTDASVVFPIARLNDDLGVDRAWQLAFGDPCDPEQGCIPYFYPRLHVLDVAEADGTSSALVLLEFDRADVLDSTRAAGVASVDFDLNVVSDLPTAIKREYGDLLWLHSDFDVHVDPGQITRDAAGYYVLAGVVFDSQPPNADPDNPAEPPRDKLLRHDVRTATSRVIATFFKNTRTHILQLPNQSALGQTPSGAWYAARLKGYEIEEDEVVELETEKDATLVRIGHGQVLLEALTGDARARLSCLDE